MELYRAGSLRYSAAREDLDRGGPPHRCSRPPASDPSEEERLRADLDQILAYMEKLEELDTTSVALAIGATEPGVVLREDRSSACLKVEEALANAPESGRGHFKVPRVIPG